MPSTVLQEGRPESVGMDPARLRRLRDRALGWVESGETPSVVMLVARRGVVVLHEAFGVRHYEDTTPTLKPDSIFPIASLTKPITASLVMCLVEDGLIGLNRPFIDYIPELDIPGVQWLEEARVADLLSHTSCIKDLQWDSFIQAAAETSPELPPPGVGQHPTINRRIRLAAGAPVARRPGSAMMYSNYGYQLLADIVRRVSGEPVWQFARSRLFQPLGMVDSSYRLSPDLRRRRVYRKPGLPGTGLSLPGTPVGCDSLEYDELDLGSTGVTSTARDLAVFLQMLLNGGSYGGQRVLSPASVAAMTRPQVDTSIPFVLTLVEPGTGKRLDIERKITGGYGYGLFLFVGGSAFVTNGSLMSGVAFGHAGYHGTYMWADPEYELVGVCLSVSPRLKRGYPAGLSDLVSNAVYGAISD
jgi:CubicO group peptidase (beta-lactamase class C family)